MRMKYYTSTTEFNCGIDRHARRMYVCVMDRQGTIRLHTNIQNNDFEFFLKRIEPIATQFSGHDRTMAMATSCVNIKN